MKAFKTALTHMLTGADNQSFDVGRVVAFFGSLTFIGLGIRMGWLVTAEHPFDFQAFGIGFGSLAAGVGALLKLKEGSEPRCQDHHD